MSNLNSVRSSITEAGILARQIELHWAVLGAAYLTELQQEGIWHYKKLFTNYHKELLIHECIDDEERLEVDKLLALIRKYTALLTEYDDLSDSNCI